MFVCSGLVYYLFACYVLMFCVGLFGGLLGVCLLLFESGGLGFGCLRGFCGVCCLFVDCGLMTVVWGLEFWFVLFGWFVLWFVLVVCVCLFVVNCCFVIGGLVLL